MPPYRPEIEPPPSGDGSWLPVLLLAGLVLVWIAAILQPIILALMEME